jgi:anaerobic ribonucleoside-triphosphate reductase activating protein
MKKIPPKASRPDAVNVGSVIEGTEVEGPGLRYALWVQGCPRRCQGCCNPELLRFEDKDWVPVDDLVRTILSSGYQGLTLLGGEPLVQATALYGVAKQVRELGMNVMLFTGHTMERIRRRPEPGWLELVSECDVIVDGPYMASQASQRRRWIGSDNQGLHILTDRCWSRDEPWPEGDHGFEIRLVGTKILVNGHPRDDLNFL